MLEANDDIILDEDLGGLKSKKKTKAAGLDPTRQAQLKVQLKRKFCHCLNLSEAAAQKLVDNNKNLMKVSLVSISRNIELLYEKDVTANTVIENLWLLGVPTGERRSKW